VQKHLQYSGEKKTSSGLIQLNYNLHNYTIPPGRVGGKSVLPGKSTGELKCHAFNYSIQHLQKYLTTTVHVISTRLMRIQVCHNAYKRGYTIVIY